MLRHMGPRWKSARTGFGGDNILKLTIKRMTERRPRNMSKRRKKERPEEKLMEKGIKR
jgi:hypothetical protein